MILPEHTTYKVLNWGRRTPLRFPIPSIPILHLAHAHTDASVFLSVIPRMVVSCEYPSNERSHICSSSTFYLLDPVYTFQRLLGPFIYQVRRIRRRLILKGLKTSGPLSYLESDADFFVCLFEKLFLSTYVKLEKVCIKNLGLRLLSKNRNC